MPGSRLGRHVSASGINPRLGAAMLGAQHAAEGTSNPPLSASFRRVESCDAKVVPRALGSNGELSSTTTPGYGGYFSVRARLPTCYSSPSSFIPLCCIVCSYM